MTDQTAAIYDAIDAFQRTHRLPGLQHAQIRGLLAEHLARALPTVPAGQAPAADRAALRDRIAEALLDHLSRTADIRTGRSGQPAFMPEIDDPERMRITDAVLPVLPAPADRAAVLTAAERTMLTYALDQAQERIWSEDGFTDEDQAAVTSLRRMAVEAQQPKEARRCAHTDVVYGRCILSAPHDDRECFHEQQPIRIDEETDEDGLCGSEYPGDDNFVGQLCGLPKEHFGEHRCDEEFTGTAYTALLRWGADTQQPEARS